MKGIIRFSALVVLVGCQPDTQKGIVSEVNQETIGKHIEWLVSDEFLGRMPFTEGEARTVKYLKEEFEKLGLTPGNGGSYFQDVPMVEDYRDTI